MIQTLANALRRRREDGSVLIEAVVVIPILLVIVLFAFEMGRAVAVQNELRDATQAAVRVAAQRGGTTPESRNISQDAFKAAWQNSALLKGVVKQTGQDPKLSISPAKCKNTTSGRYVTANASVAYKFMFPGFNGLMNLINGKKGGITTSFTLRAHSTLRCEVTW